ncbi:hypothetical protein ACIGO8_05755 [Streptomyces sp. NPDC053493]|uniref:hypothetical protein n=1 Tax=Streptomyces sp. NPDC053493 TaxID=3365705 RepID=UPI0037CD92AD
MTQDLLQEVRAVLVRAGYGRDSGLRVLRHGDGVIVSWHADPVIRPTIAVHAADPDVRRRAGIPGIRTALDTALLVVLHGAGLPAVHHPGGFILIGPDGDGAAPPDAPDA